MTETTPNPTKLIVAENDDFVLAVDMTEGIERHLVSYNNRWYDADSEFIPINPEHRAMREEKRKEAELFVKQNSVLIDNAFNTTLQVGRTRPKTDLGESLEAAVIASMATLMRDELAEQVKPELTQHIIETFGMTPQRIEVKRGEDVKIVEGIVHEVFEPVLQYVSFDIPVFLSGPAGTGKNHICKQIADSLDLEFYFSNAVQNSYQITGYKDAMGNYHPTQFYEAFKNGGLFLLDEIDASIPEVLVILNAAIANRYFDFPEGRVNAHKDFRVIAAANTFGTGADIEYVGRFQLDAATLDRFVLVEVDYSPAIEDAVGMGNTELVEFARVFRAGVKASSIKHVVSYRGIQHAAKLTAIDVEIVVRACFTKHLPRDDMRQIWAEVKKSHEHSSNAYIQAFKKMAH